MNSILISEYAEDMIKKINRYREALGFKEYEPSVIIEIALNEYLNELEDLEKTIKSGGKNK